MHFGHAAVPEEFAELVPSADQSRLGHRASSLLDLVVIDLVVIDLVVIDLIVNVLP
jgi:hypothetical protein